MSSANHKEIVNEFFNSIITKDWVQFEDLIHDDYRGLTEEALPYFLEATSVEEAIISYRKDQPIIHFTEILGFPEDIIKEGYEAHAHANLNKFALMQEMKWASKIYSSFDILKIIADDDRVWLLRKAVINDPSQQNIVFTSFHLFTFKDSRIICYHEMGRYTVSLIEYGKIVATRNKIFEMQQYVKGLKKMGILPS
jgi:hypothetical protein